MMSDICIEFLNDFEKQKKEAFERMRNITQDYITAQIANLDVCLSFITLPVEDAFALRQCKTTYETLSNKNREIKFHYFSMPVVLMSMGVLAIGSGAAIGAAAVAGGGAVAAALIVGGAGAGGLGAITDAFVNSSKETLVNPVMKADRQVEMILKKTKSNEAKGHLKNFQTESANFKKRLGLYLLGAAYLVSAAVLLAASHGVLAPVAIKIALLGMKHVSSGIIAAHFTLGTIVVAGTFFCKKLPSRRAVNLEKKITERETAHRNSGAATSPLLPRGAAV